MVSLIRGAGIGGQHASMPWPGDTRFGNDAFIEDVWFVLAAGLAGFPLTSADLGGFMVSKSEKPGEDNPFEINNLARRLCQGIMVIPNPRMHQSDSHPPKLPWNCPKRVQILYKAMLEERYRLTPYFFSLAIHASRTGEPIIRPLWYSNPDDQASLACQDQLLIGDSLMAAPVFESNAKTRDLYLPPGDWFCAWTGRKSAGGRRITVKAPMLKVAGLPLFVRAGAILPRQDVTPYLKDEIPAHLILDAYPQGTTRLDLHESKDVTHSFVCRSEAGQVEVELPNRAGIVRRYSIRLHLPRKPATVSLGGRLVPTSVWSWHSGQRVLTFTAKVPHGKTAVMTVR
jgi:alpha-glucosidase